MDINPPKYWAHRSSPGHMKIAVEMELIMFYRLDQVFQETWGTINRNTMGICEDGNQQMLGTSTRTVKDHGAWYSWRLRVPWKKVPSQTRSHGNSPNYTHIQSIAVCLNVLPSRCDLVFASSFWDAKIPLWQPPLGPWSNPSNFGCRKAARGLFSRGRQPFFRWAWQSLNAVILVPQEDTRYATFRHAHWLIVCCSSLNSIL